ncbi:MAG: hypothetical protein Q8S73_26575 [Deltaproteobacteria bacterium]|nr:hypothetical protein [Myxococcales bacterium]MDP3217701.1 hypothetical protein [Deltaproteobacteria bacterium]
MDTLTPAIDPGTGDLSLDDGALAWAPSAAIGLVVFVLRTPLGKCLADPEIGVDWRVASTDTADAPQALRREIERALRWVTEGGWITGLAVTVERAAPGRLSYTVAFHDGTRARTVRGYA